MEPTGTVRNGTFSLANIRLSSETGNAIAPGFAPIPAWFLVPGPGDGRNRCQPCTYTAPSPPEIAVELRPDGL